MRWPWQPTDAEQAVDNGVKEIQANTLRINELVDEILATGKPKRTANTNGSG